MIRNFLFAIVIIQILVNSGYELRKAIQLGPYLKQEKIIFLGESFSPLRPYLQGVLTAGYITCDESIHPMIDVQIMAPYQQAQFVLSPTILDFDSLNYEFIILKCSDPLRRLAYLKKFSASRILYQDANMTLIRKIK